MDTVTVGGIRLRRVIQRDGPDLLYVDAEVVVGNDKLWRTVIGPELEDGPISHIVEPSGILKGKPSEV